MGRSLLTGLDWIGFTSVSPRLKGLFTGPLLSLQYYMGGKGRGELLKTLIWSIQFEHDDDDDDDQYWVNIKVWEAVQISGISRTESEKHEKLAVGSTCRCSSMLWSTFWSELYQKDFFIITYGGNLSPDRFPPLSSRTKTHHKWWWRNGTIPKNVDQHGATSTLPIASFSCFSDSVREMPEICTASQTFIFTQYWSSSSSCSSWIDQINVFISSPLPLPPIIL